MARTFDEIQNNHPCFGGHKNNAGRIHLPVCPACNLSCRFCARSLSSSDKRTKNQPGVANRVLKPAQAIDLIDEALKISPEIKVAGIAGPGDTLTGNYAIETFNLVKTFYPNMIKCMSTNGLLLDERADEIIKVGVDTLTVTVNAVDPEIEAKLNDFIIYHGKKIEGVEGAKILIKNQIAGIKKIADAGITVKVNTVLVPEINGAHIGKIAETVAEAGADMYNIIPLIPSAKLKDCKAPTCVEIEAAHKAAMPYIDLFLHCNHCRADAVGIPGKTEFAPLLYKNLDCRIQETFSHG